MIDWRLGRGAYIPCALIQNRPVGETVFYSRAK
jgi:hypothetical protein